MRIRTVKPEFWDDERVASMSRGARLAYVWTWNAADDDGRLRLSPAALRAGAFRFEDPQPSLDEIRRILGELSANLRVVLYTVRGEVYGHIPNFRKHQKIDKPSPSKLPAPSDAELVDIASFAEASPNPTRSLAEPSPLEQGTGNGDQGTGNGSAPLNPPLAGGTVPVTASTPDPVATPPKPRKPRKPIALTPTADERAVFDHWQAVCCKSPAIFDDKRIKAVRDRLAEGHSVATLCDAVDGCKMTPWNRGDNPSGKPYLELALICRDTSHVEDFARTKREGLKPAATGRPVRDVNQGIVRRSEPIRTTYVPKPRLPDDPF